MSYESTSKCLNSYVSRHWVDSGLFYDETKKVESTEFTRNTPNKWWCKNVKTRQTTTKTTNFTGGSSHDFTTEYKDSCFFRHDPNYSLFRHKIYLKQVRTQSYTNRDSNYNHLVVMYVGLFLSPLKD